MPSFSGWQRSTHSRVQERFVWMAARSTWGRCVRRTRASWYQGRMRPSPHGVKNTDTE
jgi:hypothetical protein